MIMDVQNRFSSAQAITATAASADIIDLGIAGRSVGTGEDVYLVVQVVSAFTDTGNDSTVTVTLETDDNTGMSSAATLLTVGTFAALSAVGSRLIVRLPISAAYERYIGLRYTVAGGNLTTGAVTAFLTKDVDAYRTYADNSTFTS